MRVLPFLWAAAAALALPLAQGQSAPAQLVLHDKPAPPPPPFPDHAAPPSLKHVPHPPPRTPHLEQPSPDSPPPHRLPLEQRLPSKQRLSPEYAELERVPQPLSLDRVPTPPPENASRTENGTAPAAAPTDGAETDVSLCITLAGLAVVRGDAPEQGEVRLCMGADTSIARRAYTNLLGWAASRPVRAHWAHPMDVARAWAAVVHQALAGSG